MTQGTKEWADTNVNIQFGCEHGCKYCYALRMAVRRSNQPLSYRKNWAEWTQIIAKNHKALAKGYGKRKGRIMFPTTHDITPANLADCMRTLHKLLKKGNEVLITTKPHLDCIESITDFFPRYKKQIQFRFTVTTHKDSVLHEWEPFAPFYTERMAAVKCAFLKGYQTSLSIEPYLTDPSTVIGDLEPYITESIWVGVMNKRMLTKVGTDLFAMKNMWKIYEKEFILTNLPFWTQLAKGKLRLKDSITELIKKV